ncbi:MAG: SBBP repeat-containing protein, partial [Bacteroidales bacterium]|nr:SBBP repeat-containing protein [Bacteroidales bacterium]
MRDTINCSNQPLLSWVKTAGGLDVDQINDITTDELGNIYIAGAYSLEMDFLSTNLLSNGFKDFFVAKLDPNGNLIWIQSGGGPQDDEAKGIALDQNGNVYVTGIFRGQADFGTENHNSIGGTDVFLVKYNNNGVFQWGEFFGGFDDDYSNDICVDHLNNVAVTGIYYFAMSINGSSYISKGANDFFVVKFNSLGNLQWVTTHGSTINDSGVSLSCDNDGDFYVTGEFSGNLNFGSTVLSADGTKDVFLAKYLSEGTFDWAVKLGTVGNNDAAGSVACDYNNKVYVAYKADQIANQAQIGVYNAGGTIVNNFGFGGNGTIQPK